ncbi:MAG: DNA-formamidopyrimidine glycosylase [Bacilli bacterium]|nr:DNA-formamidopyrimidine glycosylase [Bacilli bacterium]
MPELPEVETVKETLKQNVIGKIIKGVDIYHNNVIEYPTVEAFTEKIRNESIVNIHRRGKWLMFELNHYYLLSHLRMEGKYFIRNNEEPKLLHELVKFSFSDSTSLRYHDTRKFGKMHLIEKGKEFSRKPLNELGLEPWDENVTEKYLKEKYCSKKLPIKTVLLDQSIITGIGNIYADEILFLSCIMPLKPCSNLTKKERQDIILNTRKVLERAITLGGTTIRTFESSEGIHGLFQNELYVHGQKICSKCGSEIVKIKVGGRGTYYCLKCQKKR